MQIKCREATMRKMAKKLIYLFILISLIHCGKEGYREFKVYPHQKNIKIASGTSGFITLAVEIPEAQHIYGNPKGPGIGKPTTVFVKPQKNFIFEPAQFLSPTKYQNPDDKDYVWIYENKTYIFVPFRVKSNCTEGDYDIKIIFDAILCETSMCIPKHIEIDCKIQILKDAPITSHDEKIQSLFIQSQPPSKLLRPHHVKACENEGLVTIPEFKPIYIRASKITNIIQAILFGLLAGFILNFMPCVLPVVSLKIMSLIKLSGESSRELIKHGFLFTLGILTSFLVLASLAAFLGYNWGELFQSRSFLIAMIAIVFLLSLSMLDVFTINIPSIAGRSLITTNQYLESYSKGLLATLLATPCSGPFLGGTLAWSFTQPPSIIFIIFMSIGIGMAIPYIVFTINPRLMRFIPKPGEWTITFERIMAFLLLATTVYLIGILERDLIMPTLWFLLIFSFALWQYGRFGALYQSKKRRMVSLIVLVMLTIAGYGISYKYISSENTSTGSINEKSFSMESLNQSWKQGRISMVKFTADWCPNCKLVEASSLNTSMVREKIKSHGIDFYTADLTKKHHEAEALLKKLGGHSIPFLAVFPKGINFFKPICLRDIYSEDDVLSAIEIAVEKPKS
jgi:thiol:disulfide interchange protein